MNLLVWRFRGSNLPVTGTVQNILFAMYRIYTLILLGLATTNLKILEAKSELIPWLPYPYNLNSSDIFNNALEIECDQNGGPGTFEQFSTFKNALLQNIASICNSKDVRQTRINGTLDEVLWQYCNNSQTVQSYLQNLTNSFEGCLLQEEKANFKMISSLAVNLIEFFCYKDGLVIAEFIADDGVECVEENSEKLKTCFAEVVNNLLSHNWLTMPIYEDQCRDYKELHTCILNVSKTCKGDGTQTKITNSLFSHIDSFTNCNEILPAIMEHQAVDESNMTWSDPLLYTQTYIIKKFQLKCQKKAVKLSCLNINKTLEDFLSCQNQQLEAFKSSVEKRIDFADACFNLMLYTGTCWSNLIGKVNDCLSEEEKYMPRFFNQVYSSMFDYYCKNDGRVMKKWFVEKNDCFEKLVGLKDFCLSQTKHVKVFLNASVITKAELCQDVEILSECFLDLTNKTCSGEGRSYEEVSKFGDALLEPCTGLLNNDLIGINL